MKNLSFPQSGSIQVGLNFSVLFWDGLESELWPCKHYKIQLEEKMHGIGSIEAL